MVAFYSNDLQQKVQRLRSLIPEGLPRPDLDVASMSKLRSRPFPDLLKELYGPPPTFDDATIARPGATKVKAVIIGGDFKELTENRRYSAQQSLYGIRGVSHRDLLLQAWLGLPCGVQSVTGTIRESQGLGVKRALQMVDAGEPALGLLNAAIQRTNATWEDQHEVTMTISIFYDVGAADILSTFHRTLEQAEENLPEWARRRPDVTRMSVHLSAEIRTDPVAHLEIEIKPPWPSESIFGACVKAALRDARKGLSAARMPRNEMLKVVRLWATATLVDCAGLGNREAMMLWDQWAHGGIPEWGVRRGGITGNSESSFAKSKRDVLAPRTRFYLSLLKSTSRSP